MALDSWFAQQRGELEEARNTVPNTPEAKACQTAMLLRATDMVGQPIELLEIRGRQALEAGDLDEAEARLRAAYLSGATRARVATLADMVERELDRTQSHRQDAIRAATEVRLAYGAASMAITETSKLISKLAKRPEGDYREVQAELAAWLERVPEEVPAATVL